MHTQFIIDSKGNKTGVILSIEEYERVMDQIEDAEDVKLYEATKEEGGEAISLEAYKEHRKLKG